MPEFAAGQGPLEATPRRVFMARTLVLPEKMRGDGDIVISPGT